MANEKPLSDKAARFAWEYPIDCNGTKAAIRAGYSGKTAAITACRLLRDPRVATEIAKAQAAVAERAGLSAMMVAIELKRIAFADLSDFVDWGPRGIKLRTSGDVDGRAVAEVSETITDSGGSKRIKLHDKLGAINQINKMFGWNAPEKQELTGKDGGPIQTESQVVFYIPENGRDQAGDSPPAGPPD